MSAWVYDADGMNLDDDVVVYQNRSIERFLNESKLFFIVGKKGLGKTLLLKTKSIALRKDPQGITFYPETKLCEKLPTALYGELMSAHQVEAFRTVHDWERVWTMALYLMLCRVNFIELPDEATRDLPDTDVLSDLVAALVSSRRAFEKLWKLRLTIRGIVQRNVSSASYMFIDNIDEMFNLDPSEHERIDRAIYRDAWMNCQVGFMDVTEHSKPASEERFKPGHSGWEG